ncbi:MAG: thiamine-phosphate kinase [Candidatus Diapherotrites archaeon]|nr:thiamine-phosphate kinase [Candidatus Diapherotrites archaeon]
MRLTELGERAIVERLRSLLRNPPEKLTTLQEDAEVFDFSGLLTVSVDMNVAGNHFQSDNPKVIGAKNVVSAATDLLAKGALPKYLLTSIGLPADYGIEFVEELYSAMDSKLKELDAFLVGGDTVEAKELTIANTFIGRTEKALLRSNMQAGDYIVLTGEVGSAALGYTMFKNNLVPEEPFVQAQLSPSIDFELCKKIIPGANAGIDVSDGLGFELNELAKQSNKKIIIHEAKLPVNPRLYSYCAEHGLDSDKLIFHSGEDYQVVYSTPEKKGIVIGRVEEGSGVSLVRKNGKEEPLSDAGWQHFR